MRSADEDDVPLSAIYSEVLEDDAELDSLDSHLADFRAGTSPFHTSHNSASVPVLPTHDGLGSFHINHSGASTSLQEQLYAFEYYNPRRIRRRRESLELAHREFEAEETRDGDKMRRIEQWRLDQSRYLLQEIEKETRRRELAQPVPASEATRSRQQSSNLDGDLAMASKNMDWHEHDDPVGPKKRNQATWTETIKSVIREIMGIDDKMLAVLFGEALPDEEGLPCIRKASQLNSQWSSEAAEIYSRQGQSWQDRILAKIARELGLLVHRISDHPGAFSTYVRMQRMPLPYAGLPAIPETVAPGQQATSDGSVVSIRFQPTIKQATQSLHIPTVRQTSARSDTTHTWHDDDGTTFTQQEWEQELDVKMVFKYLRSRFTSGPVAQSPSMLSTTATATHIGRLRQDTAAKAARVRLHHPLVSRSRPSDRRAFKATTSSSPVAIRHASSCASQSTRRSGRRGSCSYRHYWDIGGSVGTGSIIASTGPMGNRGDI